MTDKGYCPGMYPEGNRGIYCSRVECAPCCGCVVPARFSPARNHHPLRLPEPYIRGAITTSCYCFIIKSTIIPLLPIPTAGPNQHFGDGLNKCGILSSHGTLTAIMIGSPSEPANHGAYLYVGLLSHFTGIPLISILPPLIATSYSPSLADTDHVGCSPLPHPRFGGPSAARK